MLIKKNMPLELHILWLARRSCNQIWMPLWLCQLIQIPFLLSQKIWIAKIYLKSYLTFFCVPSSVTIYKKNIIANRKHSPGNYDFNTRNKQVKPGFTNYQPRGQLNSKVTIAKSNCLSYFQSEFWSKGNDEPHTTGKSIDFESHGMVELQYKPHGIRNNLNTWKPMEIQEFVIWYLECFWNFGNVKHCQIEINMFFN